MSTAPVSSPPSRRRRRILRIVAAAWILVGIGSCTSVLDVDEYASVTEEMCSLLDRCDENPGCRSNFQRHLNDADPEVRTAWLESITNYACLDSCRSGRRCLDIEPLCSFKGSCEQTRECCGSLSGHADCKAGSCCTTRGSKCEVDTDCCDDAGACVNSTCGGLRCKEATEACDHDVDCCTKICTDHACATSICSKNQVECDTSEECCSGFCDLEMNRCDEPEVCAKLGDTCLVETDCCAATPETPETPQVHCDRAPGTLEGHCATRTCSIESSDCSADGQCCSGRCEPSYFFCSAPCSKEGNFCATDLDCCTGTTCNGQICVAECSRNLCATSADCCNKNPCVGGVCRAECVPPAAHNPCTPGAPLAAINMATACVKEICAADPFCCCGAWDDLCVGAAFKQGSICTDSCL